MLYFAYGSNLDPDQMRTRCPRHKVVGMAALHDYRIAFPLNSSEWGGGVASPRPHHGTTLWGVLYELSDEDFARLDGFEGFKGPGNQHNLYDRELVTVELVRPDDDSIPRRVRATTYFARPSNPSLPSRRYLDTILAGARHHRLPEEYVASLSAQAVVSEPATPDSI